MAADSPIKGYSNIMYTFHFYAATHSDSYRQKVQAAIQKGLPGFVSDLESLKAPGMAELTKTKQISGCSF